MNLKSAKINKTTANLTVQINTVNDIEDVVALGLLTGAFNPLRKHSVDGLPIDVKKLDEYQDRFYDLIQDVARDMAVNFISVDTM